MPRSCDHFDEEVDEFHRGLQTLEIQELTPQGIQLIEDTKRLQQERLMIFRAELGKGVSSPAPVWKL